MKNVSPLFPYSRMDNLSTASVATVSPQPPQCPMKSVTLGNKFKTSSLLLEQYLVHIRLNKRETVESNQAIARALCSIQSTTRSLNGWNQVWRQKSSSPGPQHLTPCLSGVLSNVSLIHSDIPQWYRLDVLPCQLGLPTVLCVSFTL